MVFFSILGLLGEKMKTLLLSSLLLLALIGCSHSETETASDMDSNPPMQDSAFNNPSTNEMPPLENLNTPTPAPSKPAVVAEPIQKKTRKALAKKHKKHGKKKKGKRAKQKVSSTDSETNQ